MKTLIPKKFSWQKMTQKVGHMKKHLKTSTSSATTLTQLLRPTTEDTVKQLKNTVEQLQMQVTALQHPSLMYRPPEQKEHQRIAEYLDSVDERLRALEKDSHKAPSTNHGTRLSDIEQRLEDLENA